MDGPKQPDRRPESPHPSGSGVAAPHAFTWRALLLGTLSVIAVCVLAPLNDLRLSDMHLSAGFAPLAAFVLPFVLIVLVNAPLWRWAPHRALRTPELAVILLMLLVGCSLPSWGLTRFLVPTPVVPFYFGASDASFWTAFQALGLPTWLFPVDDLESGPFSEVVSWFYNATPAGESTPWTSWIVPMLVWGVFVAALLMTLVALVRITLPQWLDNERLPFPLVEVQSGLIQQPAPGFGLNELFRSRLLWIAIGIVAVIHLSTILGTFYPKQVPRLPIGYDLSAVFADPPLSYLRTKVKIASLSFIVVGLTFFIRSRAAVSLWGIYLLINLVDVQRATQGREIGSAVWADMHLGACVAFVLGMLWIGRHHYLRVVRNALGLGAPGDRAFALAARLMVAGVLVMLGWLLLMGVQWWMCALIVGFILMAHLVVTRVVAETGLPFFRCGIAASQVYTALPHDMVSGRDVYFASAFTILGPLTTRDSVMTHTMHGSVLTRLNGIGESLQLRLGAVIAWALLVGVVAAVGSTLFMHYTYPTPPTRDISPSGNNFASIHVQQRDMVNPLKEHASGAFANKSHDPVVAAGVGFAIVGVLQLLSLQFTAWPLLPVGFVASHGAFIQNAWFSIFIGWLCKTLLVRFGGAPLYQRARPFFVGLILGEGLVAGGWLIVNAVIKGLGYESMPIQLLL
jgi:hypothetical protein